TTAYEISTSLQFRRVLFLSSPLTVTVSVPLSAPPLWFSVVGLMASPLLKLAVPPLIVSSGPTLLTVPAALKLAVPPATRVSAVEIGRASCRERVWVSVGGGA